MSQKGYLAVVNISGYEEFLTQAELEHAQSIVNDLLNTLIDDIGHPLVFSKLEGNSIFLYSREGSFVQGQTLLELIENLYCTFARTLETMSRNTVCPCRACQLMSGLDLKFIFHYGTFSLTEIDGQHDLMGPDVMILRLLIKSPIADAAGNNGYLFITSACADAMSLNRLTVRMKTYSATFENLGEVKGYIHDLHSVWEHEREQRRITVKPEDAWLEVETDLPVSSALAWEYVTGPNFRKQWLSANDVTANTNDKGRMGIGTTYICSHGRYKINQVIVDWRPFEYLTVDTAMPMKGIQRHTTQLTPRGGGTRVSWRFDEITGRNRIHTLMLRMLFNSMKGKITSRLKEGSKKVLEMIENDRIAE
ncbi:MAG: DUF2652 domain-containing protein [Thermodesulfobacteriota bacterium]